MIGLHTLDSQYTPVRITDLPFMISMTVVL